MKWYWWILIVLVIVGLVGLVVGLGWWLYRRRNPSTAGQPGDGSGTVVPPPVVPVVGSVLPLAQLTFTSPSTFLTQIRQQLSVLATADVFPETLISPLTDYLAQYQAYSDQAVAAPTSVLAQDLTSVRNLWIATGVALQYVLTNVKVRSTLNEQLKTSTIPTQVTNLTTSIAAKDQYIREVLQDYIVKDVLNQ